ncbi:MAG: exo-alpha-sialidase [Bacteroidetes bacterium]|nr:exo-alpha-sialidase [Bacteroidota bacterium]
MKVFIQKFAALFILFALITSEQGLVAQNITPAWQNLMFQDGFKFDSTIKQLDSLWEPLIESESFDPEEFEDSYMQYTRWKQFWMPRASGLNQQNNLGFSNLYSRYKARATNRSSTCGSGNLNSKWRCIGPFQYTAQKLGFFQSVAINPFNHQILFAGSENGGLFKTIDGGQHWTNKTLNLDLPGLGIMDIQIDRSNINNMVASTGGSHGYGVGIIYSTQNGETWDVSNINGSANVNLTQFQEIRYDPTNYNHVWTISNGGDIYVSSDKGVNFEDLMLYRPSSNFINSENSHYNHRYLGDLEIIPSNTNHPKAIVISSNDDNAENGGGFINISKDDGNSWNFITPEPYIERFDIDFAKSGGAVPNDFKVIYCVNRPTIKISEITHDLRGFSGTYPSYIDNTLSFDYIELSNLTSPSNSVNLDGYIIQRVLPTGVNTSDIEYFKITGSSVNFSGGNVATICLQNALASPGNLFYSAPAGQFSDLTNTDAALYILRDNSTNRIIDVVAVGNFNSSVISDLKLLKELTQLPCANVYTPLWNYSTMIQFNATYPTIQLNTDDNNSAQAWVNNLPSTLTTLNNTPLPFTPLNTKSHVIASYNLVNGTWTELRRDNYLDANSSENGYFYRVSKNSMEFKLCDASGNFRLIDPHVSF